MGGKEDKSKRTLDSIGLAGQIPESNEKLQCLTLLYALFDKFGDEISKNKFKEMITMTEIGKMIRDEAIQEGKAEILIRQLIKKFKLLPNDYKNKIREMPEEDIEMLAIDIFEIENIKEIERYFK